MKLRLTPRQHELLFSDTYAGRPENEEGTTLDKGEVWGGSDGQKLRDELRAGKVVTVTPFLISEIKEFADRDTDGTERQVYKRLLRAALAAPDHAAGDYDPDCPACLRGRDHTISEHEQALKRNYAASN